MNNVFFKKAGALMILILRSIIMLIGMVYVGYWPIEQLLSEPAERVHIAILCALLIATALFIWLDAKILRKLLTPHCSDAILFVINAFALFASLIPYIGFFIICLFSSFGDSFLDIIKFIGFYLISLLIYAEFLYFNWFCSSKRNSN